MSGRLRNALLLLVAGVLAVTLAWAAADDMFPDADTTTNWNEGTGQTNAEINATNGNDGTTSTIADSGNNVTSEFGFDATPGDFGSLNTLTLKIAHATDAGGDDNPDFDVLIFDGVPTQIGGTKTSTRQALPAPTTDPFTVESFTDAGWDAMNQTQLDAMTVRVLAHTNATGMPDGLVQYITLMTVTLDYNASAGGRRRIIITN